LRLRENCASHHGEVSRSNLHYSITASVRASCAAVDKRREPKGKPACTWRGRAIVRGLRPSFPVPEAENMQRREFLSIIGGIATSGAWPFATRAQQPDRIRRLGWMDSFREDDPNARARVRAFLEVLQKLGWSVGGNLAIDYRWDLFNLPRAREAGAGLLSLAPDVIFCGGTPSALAMQQATGTLPVVFAFVTDPIGQGIVPNLSHPGGNLTGFSYFEPGVGAKWLELLKEIAPAVSRVSVVYNPVSSPYSPLYYESIEAAAPKLAIEPARQLVHELADVEQLLSRLGREPGSGVIFSADAFIYNNRKSVIHWTAQYRVPALYGLPGTAAEGGLIYYSVDIVDLCRKAAGYVDRILRGEKPADLPVQSPTKFDLTINLKAANGLGLSVPNTLIVSADQIIE
jgi:putative ABC transport system substrate-binding protein